MPAWGRVTVLVFPAVAIGRPGPPRPDWETSMFNLNALTATGQGRSPWIALPGLPAANSSYPGPER